MGTAGRRDAGTRAGPGAGGALEHPARRYDLPPMGQFGGWPVHVEGPAEGCSASGEGAYAQRYCGAGDGNRWRTDLWAAIRGRRSAARGRPGPIRAAWRADATRERITFAPGLLPYTMRYTNRPSAIQQVIEFGGHR